jgi:hypothetical protein
MEFMKVNIKRPVEVEISHVRVTLPVFHEEERIPNNFPFRSGEVWGPVTIEIDTGKIAEWPQGESGEISDMKVCDAGLYELLAPNGELIVSRQDYVPHGIIPGEYGDYVTLKINGSGIITNWPKNPNVSRFFDGDED